MNLYWQVEGKILVTLDRGKNEEEWQLTVGCTLPGKWILHWGVNYVNDVGRFALLVCFRLLFSCNEQIVRKFKCVYSAVHQLSGVNWNLIHIIRSCNSDPVASAFGSMWADFVY